MLMGKRIKDLRVEKGLSQQELGDLIGVTKVSICGYESGGRTPSLETFIELADIFETSADYLLGREMTVVNENSKEYVGAVSDKDIELIQELHHYPELYEKITKDIKRFVNLVSKRVK